MSRNEWERSLAQKLVGLSRRWQTLGDQALARLGVSNSTGWCLVYLDRLGEDARQSDLARAIGIREATLVRTLAQLERGGLIERSPNPNDARANIMRITPQGHGLVAEIESVLAGLREQVLQDVDDAELETMVRVFDLIDARLRERIL
jgi:MarR family transcriptional regulator for hemolysin